MKALDKRIARTITGSATQYGAVVIIIWIGITIFISISNMAQNLDSSLHEYYHQHRFAHLFAEFANVPVGTIHEIGRLHEIESFEARVVTDVRVDVGRAQNPLLRLIGTGPGQQINRLYVQAGSIPSKSSERGIALLAAFAQSNNLNIGDEIDLIIRGEPFSVTVMALVDSPEYIYAIQDIQSLLPDNLNFGVAFINLPLLQEILSMPGQANNAVFSLRPGVDEEAVKDKIKENYKNRGLVNIITRENQTSHTLVDMEIQQQKRMAGAVAALFLGIAALVIFMLISRLVQADRNAIGTLKATGFNNLEIIGHYLKLALLIGFTGAILGVMAGYLLSGFLSRLMLDYFHLPLLETHFHCGFILLALFSALLFCGATSLVATRGILKIAPAEAMRPATLPPGKRNLIEKWAPGLWTRITFSWKLVLRGIWRNKRRFALATLGVALTCAIIIFAGYYLGIWDVLVDAQFSQMETYDYAVSFIKPVSSEAITDLRSLAPVTSIEPFLELPFLAVRGWHEQPLTARALPKSTSLYRFEDERGNLVTLPAYGIFISRTLAKSMGVKQGDILELSSYVTSGQAHPVMVKAVVNQYFGSGVYMSFEQMECLTFQKNTFSGVLIDSKADIKGIFQNMANIESIHSKSDLEDTIKEFVGMIAAAISFIVLLGGLLGFAILYNTTSTNITEREREFSSLRVLGFTKKEIFQLIKRENAIALLAGLVAGMPLGKALVVLMINSLTTGPAGEMLYFPTDIAPVAYIAAAILTTFFMVLTLAAVRHRIQRLDFLKALSSRVS